MKSVDCLMFVYSLTDQSSFENLIQLLPQATHSRKAAHLSLTGSCIIGTKSDLLSERQVEKETVALLANQYGLKSFEVSCLAMDFKAIWEPVLRYCLQERGNIKNN